MAQRRRRVTRLVQPHFRKDRAALVVLRRQLAQVAVEMVYDLPLGFSKKSEAPAIAQQSGRRA
jgi:hypothetical protein